MWRWRLGVGFLLFVLLGIPVLCPYLELLGQLPELLSADSTSANGAAVSPSADTPPEESATWEESTPGRLLHLGQNTLFLVLGTLAGTLLPSTVLAVLLFRTDLPGRGLCLFFLLLAIFIPLPVLTVAWQALLGGQSWLPFTFWPARPGQPWTQGLLPSVWVHSLASLPWVVLIVGHGLRWVEADLEDDALLDAGPWRVLWRVTLPRCRPTLVVAGLWVAVQTAGEVGVTDMFVYRTYAEEVFSAFTTGDVPVPRAVLLSLPATVLLWIILLGIGPRLLNAFPPLESQTKPVRPFPLRGLRWPLFLAVLAGLFFLMGVPLTTLVWNAGYRGEAVGWSPSYFGSGLLRAVQVNGRIVAASFLQAGLMGVVTAGLALLACWSVLGDERGQRPAQLALFALVSLLWVISGPVAGSGLLDTIKILIGGRRETWDAQLLYFSSSPLPLWWAYLLRAFPFAVAVLWPVVRLIPAEVRQAARLDGATPGRDLLWITLPLTWPAALSAALVAMALSLAEVSASRFAATAGTETFTRVVFDRMHYGVSQDVSSLCLLLIGLLALAGLETGLRHLVAPRRVDG